MRNQIKEQLEGRESSKRKGFNTISTTELGFTVDSGNKGVKSYIIHITKRCWKDRSCGSILSTMKIVWCTSDSQY